MRIALVIYGSLDTVSGGYLYDRKLVERLRARGHEVEVVSLPWRNYARHLGDSASSAWRRTLRELSADLILEDELNHPSLAFAPRPAHSDGSRPPIVSIVHHLRMSEELPPALRPLYRAVEARYLRRADAFIFNSKTTCATVAAMRPDLPPHIISLPAGDHVLPDAFSSLHEQNALNEHLTHDLSRGLDGGVLPRDPAQPLRAAFVGNLIARKGLHTIIAALAATDAAITLAIGGSDTADPQYAARVHAQVEAAGLGARVHFLGPLSDAERTALYAQSDIFVSPSYEGFGIVYLEAMAHGLPVIAATVGAAHEVVTAGDNGFLVAPNDAATLARYLTALARDPSLLEEMSTAARAAFATFPTWHGSTTRTAQFLEELVGP